jgi:hypothetical protein
VFAKKSRDFFELFFANENISLHWPLRWQRVEFCPQKKELNTIRMLLECLKIAYCRLQKNLAKHNCAMLRERFLGDLL